MIPLDTPLSSVGRFQQRFLPKLKTLGIETVRDLLFHFPIRYEDYATVVPIARLEPGMFATITATIGQITARRTWKRNLYLMEALLRDETGTVRATWFNQPFIKNILPPGTLARFAGKVITSSKTGERTFTNPAYEIVRAGKDAVHTGRIVPVYPETRGLTSKGIRFLMQPLLASLPQIADPIPHTVRESFAFPDTATALAHVHFPNSMHEANTALRRFAFEDLFLLQLRNCTERRLLAKARARSIPLTLDAVRARLAALPYALTHSQKSALWDILRDLEKPHPMNRLLQGDVGSGKTAVAALAALHTADCGYQAAFMAPTEILARQHFNTVTTLFGAFEGAIALLTGSGARMWHGRGLGETTVSKTVAVDAIARGTVKVVIGTHALIQKAVSFHSLALVIVDEQHRFGVRQRATLTKTNEGNETMPHLLSMSATPIPRTLSLTVFGDLDTSLITELPKNRKPIVTRIIDPAHRARAYAFIRSEIQNGRQAFVLCPRIESTNTESILSEKLELKSVKEEFEKISKHIFPDRRVAMLHGKMKPKEKEQCMRAFRDGEYDVLVATSVIEVGVDVPNATVMMVESAERFGLAQLYQFRGRVGRSEHQSYCFLFTDSTNIVTRTRLHAVVAAKNGFELAELDLKLRGPGEFLGTTQSGMPDIAMKAVQNPDLVRAARDAALGILETDPLLTKHPELHNRLAVFQKNVHGE